MEAEKIMEKKYIIGTVQTHLDISGIDHIEVHISADGKTLWVNDEITCLLRVCRIKSLHLIDDRKRKE